MTSFQLSQQSSKDYKACPSSDSASTLYIKWVHSESAISLPFSVTERDRVPALGRFRSPKNWSITWSTRTLHLPFLSKAYIILSVRYRLFSVSSWVNGRKNDRLRNQCLVSKMWTFYKITIWLLQLQILTITRFALISQKKWLPVCHWSLGYKLSN